MQIRARGGARLRVGPLLLGLLLGLPLAAWADGPERSLRPVARGQVIGSTVLPARVFPPLTLPATDPARTANVDAATDAGADPDTVARPDTGAAASDLPEEGEPPADLDRLAEGLAMERALQRAIDATPVVPPEDAPRGVVTDPARLGVDTRRADATPPLRALRPRARPPEVVQLARAADAARSQGAVCGDPALQGVPIGAVPSSTPGCGIANAIRLRSVSGVALSTHSVMDCGTAKALKTWVDRGLKPVVGRYGGGVSELQIVAHYICRPRNNKTGARISEHGRGRALDIAEVRLADGRTLNVLDDWNSWRKGRMLKRAHEAACGPFGTVLGPEANALHEDHFHFDTAQYRSGSYCR